MKAAGERYQNSLAGKLKHAARQRRYRKRQPTIEAITPEKVTHQGSSDDKEDDLLPLALNEPKATSMAPVSKVVHCHFCGNACASFIRYDFIQRHSHRNAAKLSWPEGP